MSMTEEAWNDYARGKADGTAECERLRAELTVLRKARGELAYECGQLTERLRIAETTVRERIERRVRELLTERHPNLNAGHYRAEAIAEALQLIRADGTEYPALCSQPDQCRAAGRCARTPSVCNE